MAEGTLHTLLLAARTGQPGTDDAAFAELLRLVQMLVRSGMGRRLRDFRDSADVCQSVARSFIVDHRGGAIAFSSEQQLVAYLRKVVDSKLASLARADQALKRGGPSGPLDPSRPDIAQIPAPPHAIDPAMHSQRAEAASHVAAALTDEDCHLARLRLRGLDWPQIAQHLSQDPQTLRKRWSRLLDRLSQIDA